MRFDIADIPRGETVDMGDGTGLDRHVVEEHAHLVHRDDDDDYVWLPVRAVVVDFMGPTVEIAGWSTPPADARLLAKSLLILADLADEACR